MDWEIGIAGWIVSGEILKDKTLTLLEYPELCASHGVKTVELCSRFFESQDATYLNDLRRRCEDNGLTLQNIAVDMGNIAGADEAVRRTDIEALKTWFYTASAIGCKAIRINTGRADDEGGPQRVIDAYTELVQVGEQAGVKLLMENHGGISATSEGMAKIVGAVKSEWFGTCPDTGNFAAGDWEPGMQALAPRAFSAHVKVFNYSEDGIQTKTDRDGNTHEIDLPACLKILKEAGYQGPLCIEKGASATPRESIKDTVAYLKELSARV